MQPQPLTRKELATLLQHQLARAQADGLSRGQAVAVVCHRLKLNPTKLEALLSRGQR
jgi:hypothetical protein